MTLSIIFFVIVIVGFAILIWQLRSLRPKDDQSKDQTLLMLQNQISNLSQTVDTKMNSLGQTVDTRMNALGQVVDNKVTESQRAIQAHLGHSVQVIRDVTEKVTQLQETNKQVMGFTDQLKNLEKVLTNSKNRGSLGEAGLEMILSNILPPQSYEMQYRFKNGEAVDAVIKIKDNVLPVDAKFSLDNYRRILEETNEEKKQVLEKSFKEDLKKRIDETAKYIRPSEGTLDFAFMFIPAEGIYYDLLINEVGAVKVNTRSLIDYAFNEKKVIIVSPTTFAAYLQTVLQGLRALAIEKDAKEIQSNVEKLGRHLIAYDDYFKKLGNSLSTTVNHYNSAAGEFKKVDKDVIKITGKESEMEILQIDRPQNN